MIPLWACSRGRVDERRTGPSMVTVIMGVLKAYNFPGEVVKLVLSIYFFMNFSKFY